MLVYQCIKRFYCSPLERFIPVGAIVFRYENVTKLALQMAPDTTKDLSVTVADFEYDVPEEVVWFYGLESPPTGSGAAGFFTFIEQLPEDVAGGGVASAGMPSGSDTQIQYNNAGTFGANANFVFDETAVGIGTDIPNSTAILDLTSTTRGFLMPRMTTTQRDAIPSPATGLEIFNTITNGLEFFDGSDWIKVASEPEPLVREISAATTTTFKDHVISATGTFIVDLHTTVGSSNLLTIKCVSGTITIDANGTETIDGSLTRDVTSGQSMNLAPVVAGWIII